MGHEARGTESRTAPQHPTPHNHRRLWRHRDFLIFWSGQTVSLFGSQVTLLALPLTAALTLNAAPGQMLFVRTVEPPPSRTGERRSIRGEIGEGLRAVSGNRYLRTIGIWAGMFNLCGAAMLAVFLIFVTLQQAVTPDRLLGRVNATGQVISLGTLPLGALIGGVLGELVGVRPTLFVGALGICFSSLVIWHSPLRRLERMPQPLSAEPAHS